MNGTEPETQYEIRLHGHLADRWAGWFDGLTLTRESGGTTLLRGPVLDQAALHGLLQKVRDTGLPLMNVTRVLEKSPGCTCARSSAPAFWA